MRNITKITATVGTALAPLLLLPLLAIAESTETTNNVFTLGEIEVNGTSVATPEGSTEKLTAETMKTFDRRTVGEALPLLPGVSASRTGARSEQMIMVRGFDLKHVPLFLDGIPIYVPYDGYPDLGRFSTYDLSEIVVSKGFSSVLYGPNTMGGAINMVSQRPQRELEGEAGIGIASGETYSSYLNLGIRKDTFYIQTSASYVDSDHAVMSDDFTPTSTEDGGDRENSYYSDKKISAKVGYTPNETDEYAFSYINQQGEKGTPPYAGTSSSQSVRYWKWPYWDKESFYFTSNTALPEQSYLKTRIYHDIFQNSLWSYDNATYTTMNKGYSFKSHYDDYTDGLSFELGTSWLDNHLLKTSFHYKHDVHREQDDDQPELRFEDEMFSIGLEDTITISDTLSAIVGISGDLLKTTQAEDLLDSGEVEDFPTEDTSGINPQAGLFYKLTEDTTLHGTIAMKSRLPSIKDKYSYRLGTSIPNPDLDPEHSVNYEIGYDNRHLQQFQWKTAIFYNDVSDYIDLVDVEDPDNPGTTTTQNQNIGDVNLYGFEFELSGEALSALQYGASYTYTYADNRSNDAEITNVPHHKVFAYLRYTFFEKLGTQLDMEYNSKRYSSTDGSRVADGFTVINMKVSYDIGLGIMADAGVKNIFDEYYAYDEGFPEPGRTYFANLRYRF